jgi:hypothetical protein
MKTKPAASSKKQSIIVKDLKTTKNPKGGVEPIPGVDVIVRKNPGGISMSMKATAGRSGIK